MTAPRLFVLEIDGERFHCAAWPSEQERAQVLAGIPAEPPSVDVEEGRPVGRPSFDLTIAEALQALGDTVDLEQSLAGQARAVLRQIAQTVTDPEAIPSRRTVETYLASGTARRNSRRKSRRNSARTKIVATGG